MAKSIKKSLYDSDENMTEEWDYDASTYIKNEYVNGLLVNYEFYDLSKGTQNTKIEYEYDANGTLLTKEEHEPDGMLFSIGYYEDGHLKKSEVYDITLPTNPLSDTFYY